jgi:hypothetical protein
MARAFPISRVRVSGFFALSIASTCSRLRGEHLNQAPYLIAAQPMEVEQLPLAHQLPHRTAKHRLAICSGVAVGPHHQQPGAAKIPRQELQQLQRGVIGGMQIVEDQQQRLPRRRPP